MSLLATPLMLVPLQPGSMNFAGAACTTATAQTDDATA